MEYELFDYQREAALGVLSRLAKARDSWLDDRSLSSFALSAVTGAGKTVIATAVIEAMLHGSPDLEVQPDPRAAFLWVTDSPALNRQTQEKMLEASDVLSPGRLVTLDNSYLDPQLKPGNVYFLNIQQLSSTSGFAQGGTNLRQHSGWDVIGSTIGDPDVDLYLVLDEAHRGMKQSHDRPTIVRRIIGGELGANPPVPVVWGISATIERFTDAMKEHAASRINFPVVEVDIEKVRASGIVKDQIDLDDPAESGSFSSTLLRAAVADTLDFDSRWAKYAHDEEEPRVLPALVVQVRDKPTPGDLAEIVAIVEDEWEGLGPKAIVNVFGEHEDLYIGGRTVRWVRPESIEDDESIRVVFAKQAISTGWDCPRAEVLYSERPAQDATHIAQIIGRMVRSPLTRRITTDDSLNAVSCYLPNFSRTELTKVITALTESGEPGSAADVVVHSGVFERNPQVPDDVFEFVENLPSWPKPDRLASPLRRARTLARLLTDEAGGEALMPAAGEKLTKHLNAKFDGLMAQYADEVAKNVDDLETYEGHRTSFDVTRGEKVGEKRRSIQTAARDLEWDTRRLISQVKEGAAKEYLRSLAKREGGHGDVLALRTRVAALVQVEGVVEQIEHAATSWVQARLDEFRVEIKNSTGARKDAFMKVIEQSTVQERTGLELPMTLRAPTKDSRSEDGQDLPRVPSHLYSDGAGKFSVDFNDWETEIIKKEVARDSFVAWYRNPSRASTSAHRIGYLSDADGWASLQVDFIVISKRTDGTYGASIIDPHGDHLADARAKLRGLARFADEFGEHFVRIESIAKGSNGKLRVIDLLDEDARAAVVAFEGGQVTSLYDSGVASDYL